MGRVSARWTLIRSNLSGGGWRCRNTHAVVFYNPPIGAQPGWIEIERTYPTLFEAFLARVFRCRTQRQRQPCNSLGHRMFGCEGICRILRNGVEPSLNGERLMMSGERSGNPRDRR